MKENKKKKTIFQDQRGRKEAITNDYSSIKKKVTIYNKILFTCKIVNF